MTELILAIQNVLQLKEMYLKSKISATDKDSPYYAQSPSGVARLVNIQSKLSQLNCGHFLKKIYCQISVLQLSTSQRDKSSAGGPGVALCT